jgi:hypothetical protein
LALPGSKRAAAARSLLTSSELKALQIHILRCLREANERETRNPRLDRQQMTSGRVRPVGAPWSELMLDHCCFPMSG